MKNLIIFLLSTFLMMISFPNKSETQIPDYTGMQGYLYDPPSGLNVEYARQYPGGRGEGINIFVIDHHFNLNHVDIDDNTENIQDIGYGDHGTAVMGIMVGEENSFGITGIAPEAYAYAISPQDPWQFEDAIFLALESSNEGDIIVIEAEVPAQYNYHEYMVPAEYNVWHRQVINQATTQGRIVIEVAGNNPYHFYLDNLEEFSTYPPYTNAIIVGAGNSQGDGMWHSTNYGSRVDCNGWGENIVTCGDGHLYKPENQNEWYTDIFDGTSGATPMVAGVVAILQGIYKAKYGYTLFCDQIQELLRDPNNCSTPISGIGGRPDLKKLIKALQIEQPVTVDQRAGEYTLANEVGYWNSTIWENKGVPWHTSFDWATDQTLLADQNLVLYGTPSVNKKYHHWGTDDADKVLNYRTFHITNETSDLIAQFYTSNDA